MLLEICSVFLCSSFSFYYLFGYHFFLYFSFQCHQCHYITPRNLGFININHNYLNNSNRFQTWVEARISNPRFHWQRHFPHRFLFHSPPFHSFRIVTFHVHIGISIACVTCSGETGNKSGSDKFLICRNQQCRLFLSNTITQGIPF